MKKWILVVAAMAMAPNALAFKCYITFMKGKCWSNYDVSIAAMDGDTKKLLTSTELKKDTFWKRTTFDCKPRQAIAFSAKYTPKIWKTNKQTHYDTKQMVYLPVKVKKDESAWEIPICFSTKFSEVPIPPTAKDLCDCSFEKDIPKIPEGIIHQKKK